MHTGRATSFRRALSTNSNASGFTSKIPTITRPSGDGVIDLTQTFGQGPIPASLRLMFLGLGDDDNAFSVRLYSWNRTVPLTTEYICYQPSILTELAVVVGTTVGVAGSSVLATERFADTVTIVKQPVFNGTDNAGAQTFGYAVRTFSPGSNLIGYADVRLEGAELLEFDFDQTTGTPTMNVLYAPLCGTGV